MAAVVATVEPSGDAGRDGSAGSGGGGSEVAVAIVTNADGTLEPWGPDECQQFVVDQEAQWCNGASLRAHELRQVRGMLGIGMTEKQVAGYFKVALNVIEEIAADQNRREERAA